MAKFHNQTYVQTICMKEYTAPREVVNAIYENGGYITSSKGKYMEVHRCVNGKDTYEGSLASFVTGYYNNTFKDGNTRKVTLRNLTSK